MISVFDVILVRLKILSFVLEIIWMDAPILFTAHVLPQWEMFLLVDFVERCYKFRRNTTMTKVNNLHVFLFITNDK